MGFRGSRVQIPPSRLVEEQASHWVAVWGFFFVAPRAVSNAVSFYRLTIRCVGCNTTFLIVSASACWYDDVPIPKTEVKKTELDMAIKFIDQGIAEEFRPQEYKD